MSCHKCLIFSTHVTKPCHGTPQIPNIQYSYHIFMSRHATNILYSVLMSHMHVITLKSDIQDSCHSVMSCHVISRMSDIQYSNHTDMSCHKWWYSVLMSHRYEMSCHVYLIFSTHDRKSCYVMSQKPDIQ